MHHTISLLLAQMLLLTASAVLATPPVDQGRHAVAVHRDTMYSRSDGRALQLHGSTAGVVVDIVEPASATGLRAGDTIVAVGEHKVTNLGSLQAALRALDGREATLVLRAAATTRTVRVAGKAYATWIPPDAPPPPPPPPPRPTGASADASTPGHAVDTARSTRASAAERWTFRRADVPGTEDDARRGC